MRVFIAVDLEGISGIFCRDQVIDQGMHRGAEARGFMAADINACVAGLKAAGVDYVTVYDCHGGGYVCDWSKLSDDIDEFHCGDTGDDRFFELETYDALILLGYHAMAGTAGAVLEHSMSSARIQNYWINGNPAGEIAIDAGIAGDKGVPVIMVSGDDKACTEAKKLLPWVKTAQVKRGLSTYGAAMLPPGRARKLIRDTAEAAVRDIANAKCLVFDKPIRFRVEHMERNRIPNVHKQPGMKVIDGRTFEIEADTVEDAFFKTC